MKIRGMNLTFRVDRGDEHFSDPIVLRLWHQPDDQAGFAIKAVHLHLKNMLTDCRVNDPIQIQVFLDEVRIQSQMTLGEQGVVDGSLLTVRWWWSEEQRKNTKCLTLDERLDEYNKRRDDIISKREAFLREKGTTEEELASIGFFSSTQTIYNGRKRTRSPSEGRAGYDTYMMYRSLTGEAVLAETFADDTPEEARMLDMGRRAAIVLKVRPEQIKMQKELDVISGECKILVTVVPLPTNKRA